MGNDWQCQRCGAAIGLHDRVCLSCERAADPTATAAGLPPGLQRLVPAQTSYAQAPRSPARQPEPGLYVPPPRPPGDTA